MASDDREGVAIAKLTNHNLQHLPAPATTTTPRRSQFKPPQISRPMLKQDIPIEEWCTFLEEWKHFKKLVDIQPNELADQLFQCCDRPLAHLLLRENPLIVDEGEVALLAAMKKMAVLQVATSVRRAKLRAMTQDHGQFFREFYANVRASANTCEYTVKCPHPCCAEKENIDYTPNIVKEILIAGINDNEIHKDVLSHPGLDTKSDKDIVQLVEEKEIAKNACGDRSQISGITGYRKKLKQDSTESSRAGNPEDTNNANSNRTKLSLKGKCAICKQEMSLYIKYRSGKMNKDPFSTCVTCFKAKKAPPSSKESETSVIASFIESLAVGEEDTR